MFERSSKDFLPFASAATSWHIVFWFLLRFLVHLQQRLTLMFAAGFTAEGMGLLQDYVDRTADVQTAALLCTFFQSPQQERPSRWISHYRDLLDRCASFCPCFFACRRRTGNPTFLRNEMIQGYLFLLAKCWFLISLLSQHTRAFKKNAVFERKSKGHLHQTKLRPVPEMR